MRPSRTTWMWRSLSWDDVSFNGNLSVDASFQNDVDVRESPRGPLMGI